MLWQKKLYWNNFTVSYGLNIEYLSPPAADFYFKKDGAKRHPQIFNLQSSIFNSGLSGLCSYYIDKFSTNQPINYSAINYYFYKFFSDFS